MRRLTTAALVRSFMAEVGKATSASVSVYLTGGATAILHGWRETTIDIDFKMVPESDEVLRALPRLKESLQINIELAAPDQFIPELRGWRERSRYIGTEGQVAFFHYDLYAQALSKIERGHAQDVEDVAQMLAKRLIDKERLLRLFEQIEPELYRYPAIDPAYFRRAVVEAIERQAEPGE